MSAAPRDSRRSALAVAALVFGLAASMTYLCERLYERLHFGRIDPRDVLAETHATFYWRAFIAAWWGGFVAFIVYRLMTSGTVEPSRLVKRLVPVLLLLFPIAVFWAYRFPMTYVRVIESIHGHVGILAAIALLHPAILLRRGQQLSRGSRWALGLSTGFSIAAFSLGISIYEYYRTYVKRGLFLINVKSGLLFETKEHLAFVVVAMATGALVCAFVAPKEARDLRRAAAAAYLTAALCALVVCALGTWVAAVHSFPE